jgi:hypothetical protein
VVSLARKRGLKKTGTPGKKYKSTHKKTAGSQKRNYRKEYDNYHSKPAAKKARARNNAANRAAGTYGNGDGKDIAHSKPKARGSTYKQAPSANRSFKRTKTARRATGRGR